jgi:hypothetical protein
MTDGPGLDKEDLKSQDKVRARCAGAECTFVNGGVKTYQTAA